MNKVHLKIFCKGCNEKHVVRVQEPHAWKFNGDLEKPTITPSLLIRTGHFMTSYKKGDPCWCKVENSGFDCKVCHSFITDGKIQYLGDCTHDLAGQTVDLPDIDGVYIKDDI